MTLNLIETLKTSIYNPKDAKNTHIPPTPKSTFSKSTKSIFFKNLDIPTNQCFILICMALLIFYISPRFCLGGEYVSQHFAQG